MAPAVPRTKSWRCVSKKKAGREHENLCTYGNGRGEQKEIFLVNPPSAKSKLDGQRTPVPDDGPVSDA